MSKVIDLADYREQAREWLSHADIPDVPLNLDERFLVLREWQRTLFENGWVGIDWSCAAGGQGLTPMHQLVFAEELARARAPMPIGLIGLDVVGPSIDHYGQPWQREELLPKLLSGEHIWCQGFSEPDAGSDLASLRTRAVADGEDFVISGQKVWTSWAHKAQWCALLVRTDPEVHQNAGISYVLVDMNTPGVTAHPLEQMTGDREFCEVFFDQVRVPQRNLVGELNNGWAVATHTLGIERAAYTVRRRVDYEVAFEDALAQLRAGGVPRADTPAGRRVRHAVGEAQIALKVLGAQTRKTVARLESGEVPTAEDSVDKLLLNNVEQTVFAALVELLGPFRSVPGSRPFGLDSARWVHDHLYSRATSIYGGTSQIQKNIIAERLLGLPRG
ncbi:MULTISPECIES: acyl-CoA dehydrogenase family protein [unclassified Rhodococcus (in: high G+C Gram-positive bacteria)]|uniref:acyl-CoA dehydrogenase family protein n=1 Tax=unclassified Rhodococcus (in: high G+C Gram-positive bacteria) TaxID=192944 RepID=UPI0028A1B3DF|nr:MULTISPECIES: acyl-CoA dehydrogenase family protein [unclassified Rhodococcus (in: high G+C Gram-positive bacteria)]